MMNKIEQIIDTYHTDFVGLINYLAPQAGSGRLGFSCDFNFKVLQEYEKCYHFRTIKRLIKINDDRKSKGLNYIDFASNQEQSDYVYERYIECVK